MTRILLPVLMGLIGLSACSTERMAVRVATPLVQGQVESIHEESDVDLADHAIPAGIKMLEGLLKSDPDNPEILNPLAEGLCNYAFSFVEDRDPERASHLYLRGRQYAARALQVAGGPPGYTEMGMDEFKQVSASIPAGAMPALYWVGRCWSGWLMLNLDDLEALAAISKLEIAMTRVLQWDETYDFAGPHLFFGAFYGSRSKMLGGDPGKSKAHFEQAVSLTGGQFLMAQLLYAKLYAVGVQDKKLFEKLLNDVQSASADALPERRLANEVAKMKARALLEDADVYF